MSDDRTNEILLEVTNVRIKNTDIHVQLKGDKADKEPVWWPVFVGNPKEKRAEDLYHRITEGLDKKRTVLASLMPKGASFEVKYVRIQLSDSSVR